MSVGGLAEVTRVEGQRARCCVRVACLNPGGSVSVYIDAHTDSRLGVRTAPINDGTKCMAASASIPGVFSCVGRVMRSESTWSKHDFDGV